jgi:head-tail adaptor|tara:strand:- start:139 stop:510 length:372 start_codon:yes stop_codon:yes gene_type:complete
MISVGNLDTPIVIEKPTFTQNNVYGGIQNSTWAGPLAGVEKVWAYLIWRTGGEREEGDQQVGKTVVDFYIRYETYKDTIKPNWRIRHTLSDGSGQYYYINKIAHIDGRHKMTRLEAIVKDSNE